MNRVVLIGAVAACLVSGACAQYMPNAAVPAAIPASGTGGTTALTVYANRSIPFPFVKGDLKPEWASKYTFFQLVEPVEFKGVTKVEAVTPYMLPVATVFTSRGKFPRDCYFLPPDGVSTDWLKIETEPKMDDQKKTHVPPRPLPPPAPPAPQIVKASYVACPLTAR